MARIYTFYRKDTDEKPIIVSAATYLEAVSAVKELTDYADLIYNFTEFKQEEINAMPYLNVDRDYWELPYILSEEQYETVKKITNERVPKEFVRKEIDNSIGDKNYNCGILTKMNPTIDDCINKINQKNGITKDIVNEICNKEDDELLKNINKNLTDILQKYVGQMNNQETRKNISNDIFNLFKKYEKVIDNNQELNKNNKSTIEQLKNKIKGED